MPLQRCLHGVTVDIAAGYTFLATMVSGPRPRFKFNVHGGGTPRGNGQHFSARHGLLQYERCSQLYPNISCKSDWLLRLRTATLPLQSNGFVKYVHCPVQLKAFVEVGSRGFRPGS